MTSDELKTLVEHGLAHARANGEEPKRLCVNQALAEQIGDGTYMGLAVKIVDALPEGKVLVE